MSDTAPLLRPGWPAPARVGACFSTRQGGVSAPPWAGFNLAEHVADDLAAVRTNRAALQAALGPAVTPCWLQQVHGNTVARLEQACSGLEADAAITCRAGLACVVMVADCVPVLLCDRGGHEVAAVHAGWRGLAGGVIARAVAAFTAPPAALMAWIGPAIGADAYRVDDGLRARFLEPDPTCSARFERRGDGWQCDLHGLAHDQLAAAGVSAIHGERCCVFSQPQRF